MTKVHRGVLAERRRLLLELRRLLELLLRVELLRGTAHHSWGTAERGTHCENA